ncbi:MAG TPA: cytochrome c biogenesis protein CcdA [Nitrospiria bacterium]
MLETAAPISYSLAFMAGFLSFISPCVLPLVPSYVSFITGLSIDELKDPAGARQARWLTLKNSLLFILGFSLVFIAFGASASLVGQTLLAYQAVYRKIGGVLVILFGLYLIGILKLPYLSQYRQFQFQNRPAGAFAPVLIGVAFAAGWTPCVGPILGTIFLYASTTHSMTQGIALLTAYSIGLGLPLLATALSVNTFLSSFKKIKNYLWLVSWISGLFLIFVGVLLFTNSFRMLAGWMTRWGIGWTVGQ